MTGLPDSLPSGMSTARRLGVAEMSPDWEFNPDKDANDMTPEQLKASLAASLASIKAGVHRVQETDEDEEESDDVETDEPVPTWFKVAASLVLFSPFITAMLYIILR